MVTTEIFPDNVFESLCLIQHVKTMFKQPYPTKSDFSEHKQTPTTVNWSLIRSLNIWETRVLPPTSIEQTSIRALRSNSASPCPRSRTASRWRTARSPSSVISRLLLVGWDDGPGEPWECHGNGGLHNVRDVVKPEFLSVFIGELEFKDAFDVWSNPCSPKIWNSLVASPNFVWFHWSASLLQGFEGIGL